MERDRGCGAVAAALWLYIGCGSVAAAELQRQSYARDLVTARMRWHCGFRSAAAALRLRSYGNGAAAGAPRQQSCGNTTAPFIYAQYCVAHATKRAYTRNNASRTPHSAYRVRDTARATPHRSCSTAHTHAHQHIPHSAQRVAHTA